MENLLHVRSSHLHFPFRCVQKAENEFQKRRLARARAAHDGERLPLLHTERNLAYDRRAAVACGNAFHLDGAVGGIGDGSGGVFEFGLLLEHFQNALCGDLRARDHVEEHDKHHERRNDLRGELGEGEHFGEEGGVVVAHDDEAPQPIDGERQTVEDEHHEGVHERHCAACEGVVLLKGGAHLFEAGALVLLRIVGAHDADARERITQGAVEAVGELLDELEAGQRDGEDGGDAAANGTAETAQSGENVNNADEA